MKRLRADEGMIGDLVCNKNINLYILGQIMTKIL